MALLLPLACSQAAPEVAAQDQLTPVTAAGIVGVISIFNCFGRVFWAAVSDYLGRARVYFLLYLIQAMVFFALPRLHTAALFTSAVALVGLCYGGGFGVMPSFTADFFGARYMGGIYGWILLAWSAGEVPSPMLIARVRQATGTYQPAIQVIAVVMLCSLVLPLIAKRPQRGPGKLIQMPGAKSAA
jgi:OFA family oxalate/formate antiporter-like MFS transporter